MTQAHAKAGAPGMNETAKRALRRAVPLPVRQAVAAWLGRQEWVAGRGWLCTELLRDFAERDPNAYHRFLWTHHLAYAETYRVDQRFGADRINQTRHLLFEDLRGYLLAQGITPERDIRSVFEVGCSLGYLLRHVETGLFASATTLEGIDIDRQAIADGSAHLAALGSRVHLVAGDMSELDQTLHGRMMDVFLCPGVLMYLKQDDASEVVRSILRHTGVVAAFAGLANPDMDNAELAASGVRGRDGTFIHNIDAMVRDAGGAVVWRRWEGPRIVDGNTIYFVFARRGGAAA